MPGNFTLEFELLNYNNKEQIEYLSNKVNLRIREANKEEEELLVKYSNNKLNSKELIKLLKNNPNSQYRLLLEKQLLDLYSNEENGENLIAEYVKDNASTKLIKMLTICAYTNRVSKFMEYDNFKKAVKKVGLESFVNKRIAFQKKYILHFEKVNKGKQKDFKLPERSKRYEE